jgi:acetyl-CoA carboxylase biotin carboxyl carrier protein
MNVNDIKKLVSIIQESDLSEFHYESEGTVIKISRKSEAAAPAHTPTFPQGAYIAGFGGAGFGAGYLPSYSSHQPELNPDLGSPAGNITAIAQPAAVVAPSEVNENLFTVECPVVGTFYRKPSPDASVFVNEGDRVKKGDTLCIVEAMKVMNEVDAPCDGVVTKVCVTDGVVVEYGEALFLIKP